MIKTTNLYYLFLIFPMLLNLMIMFFMMLPTKNNFHPISLMIILIMTTLFISMNMNFYYFSLISFILFLAMIGGLMIIFMYITSLTNNELFNLNFKNLMFNMMKILPLIMLFMYLFYINKNFNFFNFNIQDTWKIYKYQFIYDQYNLNNLFNEINNKSSMFIMIYIYYSMICIMNICYKLKAPLRQMMN